MTLFDKAKSLLRPSPVTVANRHAEVDATIEADENRKDGSVHSSIYDEGNIHLVKWTEVQSKFTPAILQVLTEAPVWMSPAERLLLFTLVFTTRPKRYLEIGTFQGGSAALVCAAMDAAAIDGTITCVDPEPRIAPELWSAIEHRTSKLVGFSPQILHQAQQVAGGNFDFILIDGDHTYEGALRDAEGVLSVATPNAFLLFHDSLFPDVKRAIDDFVLAHPSHVADFGLFTREYSTQSLDNGTEVRWGGLRMLKTL